MRSASLDMPGSFAAIVTEPCASPNPAQYEPSLSRHATAITLGPDGVNKWTPAM
jgi:hypothetical protein